jgi:hypothetical protein
VIALQRLSHPSLITRLKLFVVYQNTGSIRGKSGLRQIIERSQMRREGGADIGNGHLRVDTGSCEPSMLPVFFVCVRSRGIAYKSRIVKHQEGLETFCFARGYWREIMGGVQPRLIDTDQQALVILLRELSDQTGGLSAEMVPGADVPELDIRVLFVGEQMKLSLQSDKALLLTLEKTCIITPGVVIGPWADNMEMPQAVLFGKRLVETLKPAEQ